MRAGIFLLPVALAATQWYPQTPKGDIPASIEPYKYGQDILMECINRNIDNGEHKFDEKGRIKYGAFPTCKETGKPLTFRYGVSEDLSCTIGFSDELYHMFQLYVHEDVPFSCRIPVSSEPHSLEKGGAYIPLTFNFRGEVHDSHVDIDHNLNVVFARPNLGKNQAHTVVSAVAWSSGTNATRIVINDFLTLNLAVRWWDSLENVDSQAGSGHGLPFDDGFYRLSMNSIPLSYLLFFFYLALAGAVSAAVTLVLSYRRISKLSGYSKLDSEAYPKKD